MNRLQTGYYKARIASETSDYDGASVGCAAYYNDILLAKGSNSTKTHTLQAMNNYARGFDGLKFPACMHAEMNVVSKIRNLDIDFSKVQLYIYRGNSKSTMMCRPCPACEKAIRDLGIKKIHYTGNNSFISEIYT